MFLEYLTHGNRCSSATKKELKRPLIHYSVVGLLFIFPGQLMLGFTYICFSLRVLILLLRIFFENLKVFSRFKLLRIVWKTIGWRWLLLLEKQTVWSLFSQ